jgi:hypothetical protein
VDLLYLLSTPGETPVGSLFYTLGDIVVSASLFYLTFGSGGLTHPGNPLIGANGITTFYAGFLLSRI